MSEEAIGSIPERLDRRRQRIWAGMEVRRTGRLGAGTYSRAES